MGSASRNGRRSTRPYTPGVTHHVLAIAESDSYLKWAAALLGQLPPGGTAQVVVPCSPVRPSPEQRRHALAGTPFAEHLPDVLSVAGIRRRIERDRPDAVLLACTGPTAHAVQDGLTRLPGPYRPVLVAGIPGIALPARRKAWDYRGAVDLMVVHSRREAEEYERLRLVHGKTGRVGLATLPFLPLPHGPDGSDGSDGRPQSAGDGRNRVVFATQGKVPSARADRLAILRALARLAANRPDLDVVVKTRGRPGEFHTHYEAHHYQELWRGLVRAGEVHAPDAVRFATGSMAEHLALAAGFVTVSSTAALEAIALDVPLLLIDEFGVSERLINQVFVGSGCLAGLAALEQGEFRRPKSWWLRDNYFHPAAESTWTADLATLVEAARAGRLPAVAAGLHPGRSPRRRRRDRWRLTRAGSALVRTRRRLGEFAIAFPVVHRDLGRGSYSGPTGSGFAGAREH